MNVLHPVLLAIAVVVVAGLVAAYVQLQRRRTGLLVAAGLSPAGGSNGVALRRHLPYALFLAAIALLLLAVARPQATIGVARTAGTVVLAFDVSNSMGADDVEPSRLAAAKAAAIEFIGNQPDSVDIAVVAFGQGALVTQAPTAVHEEAVAAINRLSPAGGTSLGQAILVSLSSIVGKTVSLPDPSAPTTDLGYWGSATIVLLSDGEDTGDPNAAVGAAELAAGAGVHIETIGVGTARGATIKVDGYEVATALDAELLTSIADTTNGSYHGAADAAALNQIYQSLDLRTTVKDQPVELTGVAVGGAALLLTVGGLLMILWFGRIV